MLQYVVCTSDAHIQKNCVLCVVFVMFTRAFRQSIREPKKKNRISFCDLKCNDFHFSTCALCITDIHQLWHKFIQNNTFCFYSILNRGLYSCVCLVFFFLLLIFCCWFTFFEYPEWVCVFCRFGLLFRFWHANLMLIFRCNEEWTNPLIAQCHMRFSFRCEKCNNMCRCIYTRNQCNWRHY